MTAGRPRDAAPRDAGACVPDASAVLAPPGEAPRAPAVTSETAVVQLRDACTGDALAVARVHVRSWQRGYRGLSRTTCSDALRPEARAARYAFDDPDPCRPATVLAVEREAIRGFATTAPSTDDALIGELIALYVDPDHWGGGIGRALMDEARGRLARQGFSSACLWLFAGNERAARFYRSGGWVPDGRRRTDVVWGIAVDVIGYRRPLT